MTDAVMVAIIAAVPASLGAAVGILNGRKADKIHVLVNSNLSQVKADLAIAHQRIADLEKIVIKGKP